MTTAIPSTLARAMACMAPPPQPEKVMFFDWAGVNLAFDVHTEPGQAETLTDPGFAPDVTVGKVRINGKWVDAEDFLGSDAVITITRALTQRVCEGVAS